MTTRRTFLGAASAIYPLGSLGLLKPNNVAAAASATVSKQFERDYFKEIGVTPFINAGGNYSAYGGARMRPEVAQAIRYGSLNKVRVDELHDAVGEKIAKLAGCESAMVTSGATASMVVGSAACMTMGDQKKIDQLPDTTGLENEVIIQTNHRYTYDRALIAAGAVLVEVANEQELKKAIGPKTAMMFVLLATKIGDSIPTDRYLAIAKENNIPTFLDAATMTPPASNVQKACKMGFDLIGFSGGKGLRGPYSTGLLLGRKDLIAYSRANSSPKSRAIGRGMKVAPEEYLSMLVALEVGLKNDQDEDFTNKRKVFSRMVNEFKNVPTVKSTVFTSEGLVDELFLDIDWDRNKIKITNEELVEELKVGTPSIRIRSLKFSKGKINVSSTVLDVDDEIIVGKRIREILMSRV